MRFFFVGYTYMCLYNFNTQKAGGVLDPSFCFYVGIYFIPFNLICNNTTFRKKFWPFDPNPRVQGVCKGRIYDCMVLYAPLSLIWYARWLFSEKMFWPFDPTTGVVGLCKDKICTCMALYVPFPLLWFATWLLPDNKTCFDLLTHPGTESLCKDKIWTCMVLYAPFHYFDLQHDYFKKNNNMFWPFDPTQGTRVWVRTACVLVWCSILHSI